MAGRRRGRGEGSVNRRKDGRWVGQYEVNGKRRYVYGRTRKEVALRLNKAIAEREAGLSCHCENLTLAEYLWTVGWIRYAGHWLLARCVGTRS